MSSLPRLVALWLCLSIPAVQAAPHVVASIKPVHSLLAALMQGVGEPVLLLDGSVAPADYVPDAAAYTALANADLVVWVGPELETQLGTALVGRTGRAQVIELLASDTLKILPASNDAERRDAWFWLDSRNMLILLDDLTRVLSALDPANTAVYERNRVLAYAPINELDRLMEFRYRDVSGVPVLLYHDTHRYFSQAYAMNVAATVASPPGASEGVAAGLLDFKMQMERIPEFCLFTEAGLDEPHLAFLLSDNPAQVVELDSLGVNLAPGPDLYVQLMRANFSAISTCARRLHVRRNADVATGTLESDKLAIADVLPHYVLHDQYGRNVSHEDFPGRFQLIAFGYTFCPDICPTSLTIISRTLGLLGEDASKVQPIFITVDPERDTPAVLGKYVHFFHRDMLGLSGSPEATRRIAQLFKVQYEKVPAENGDAGKYSMDHTASLYLLGPHGEFLTKFAHGLPAAEVVERIRAYMPH